MADVIFVATQFYLDGGYRSYVDFFRLVELAGYPIIPLAQLDPSDASKTYIVTPINDEWLTGWPGAKARIIHWECEWRWDWRADVDEPPGVAEVWASDKLFAIQIGAKYVPMGSHPDLNVMSKDLEPVAKIYDVAQVSYQVPRRQAITSRLKSEGLSVAQNENLWGVERSLILRQSKVMVHVHQHENAPGVAPLRWCLAAAHQLPLITETIPDRGIFGYSYLLMSSYHFLPEFTAMIIRDSYSRLNDFGMALHDLLCRDLTFRKSVEAAL
jgi:hypothetical protein